MICHDLHAKICEFFSKFHIKKFLCLKEVEQRGSRRKENFIHLSSEKHMYTQTRLFHLFKTGTT